MQRGASVPKKKECHGWIFKFCHYVFNHKFFPKIIKGGMYFFFFKKMIFLENKMNREVCEKSGRVEIVTFYSILFY